VLWRDNAPGPLQPCAPGPELGVDLGVEPVVAEVELPIPAQFSGDQCGVLIVHAVVTDAPGHGLRCGWVQPRAAGPG
jgi:hypothetical protein